MSDETIKNLGPLGEDPIGDPERQILDRLPRAAPEKVAADVGCIIGQNPVAKVVETPVRPILTDAERYARRRELRQTLKEAAPPSEKIPENQEPDPDREFLRKIQARKAAARVALDKKRADEELERHLMERALRAKARPTPVVRPSIWSRSFSAIMRAIKSRTLHKTLAYGCIALLAGKLGMFGIGLVLSATEHAYREECRSKDLDYVATSGAYCYDTRHFVYLITDGGVSGRLHADWTINQRELRLASRAEGRHVAPFRTSAPVAPAVPMTPLGSVQMARIGPSTISELAQDLARAPVASQSPSMRAR